MENDKYVEKILCLIKAGLVSGLRYGNVADMKPIMWNVIWKKKEKDFCCICMWASFVSVKLQVAIYEYF
jgi:hypothetical protein